MVSKAQKKNPKFQSERAAEKKSKALERGGTAVLEGKPDKAKKEIEKATKGKKGKKPTERQASAVLAEIHALEMQVTALDHKIEGVKEHYKELKSTRERLISRIRGEARDMGQGRLEFDNDPPKSNGTTKDAAPAHPKTADREGDGKTPPPTNSETPRKDGATEDPIDRELGGGDDLESATKDDSKPSGSKRRFHLAGKP